jgi:hypothetical protein
VGEKKGGEIWTNKMYKFGRLLDKVGMTKNQSATKPLTGEELQLIEQLREHPQLPARFQSMLGITRNEGAALKRAGEVGGVLIKEMRRPGHAGMSQWAVRAEERVGRGLKSREPQVRRRKKNAEMVVCVRAGGGAGADLEHGGKKLRASFAGAFGSIGTRSFAPAGA